MMNISAYQIFDMSAERILAIALSKLLLIAACVILLRFRFDCAQRAGNIVLLIILPIITQLSTVGIMQAFLNHAELKSNLFLAAISVLLSNALAYCIFIKINKSIETEAQVLLLRQNVENDKKERRG